MSIYIRVYDGINTNELSPRPLRIDGWGDPIRSTESETIDGNVKDFIPKYKIRKMTMIWNNLNEVLRDQVLENIEEFKDYTLLIKGLQELFSNEINEVTVPVHIKGIRISHRRVPIGYLYDIAIEMRDRI